MKPGDVEAFAWTFQQFERVARCGRSLLDHAQVIAARTGRLQVAEQIGNPEVASELGATDRGLAHAQDRGAEADQVADADRVLGSAVEREVLPERRDREMAPVRASSSG